MCISSGAPESPPRVAAGVDRHTSVRAGHDRAVSLEHDHVTRGLSKPGAQRLTLALVLWMGKQHGARLIDSRPGIVRRAIVY